jgi:hypothetical protein
VVFAVWLWHVGVNAGGIVVEKLAGGNSTRRKGRDLINGLADRVFSNIATLNWQVRESDHFLIHYFPNSAAQGDINKIVDITPVPHNGVRAPKIRRV